MLGSGSDWDRRRLVGLLGRGSFPCVGANDASWPLLFLVLLQLTGSFCWADDSSLASAGWLLAGGLLDGWLLAAGCLVHFWVALKLDSRRILRGSSTGDETG